MTDLLPSVGTANVKQSATKELPKKFKLEFKTSRKLSTNDQQILPLTLATTECERTVLEYCV